MLQRTVQCSGCKNYLFSLQRVNYSPGEITTVIRSVSTTSTDNVLLLLACSITVAYILDAT